eukprot:TRINITY_DN369_c0_g1_i12.p1 TRINITY_DN369_c0_g1~~TRINITY_DN369_c0_g1_i12.p1  ORF type:complete len:228 (-),score=88.80 TRINITY_DN369_c0_g1_i12:230-913(-)
MCIRDRYQRRVHGENQLFIARPLHTHNTYTLIMSWNDYVNYLLANNVCEAGAILANDSAALWAGSPGFNLTSYEAEVPTEDGAGTRKVPVNEAALLLEAFNNKGIIKSGPSGLRINGQRYYCVSFDAENSTMYLKKEKGGACAVRTNKAIVFGSFSVEKKLATGAAQNPGETNKAVEALAKTLKDAGYQFSSSCSRINHHIKRSYILIYTIHNNYTHIHISTNHTLD